MNETFDPTRAQARGCDELMAANSATITAKKNCPTTARTMTSMRAVWVAGRMSP
jgi:hypothetical protein